MTVTEIERVKRETGQPYRIVCQEMNGVYSSIMRWKSHIDAGMAPAQKPGPAKVEPLDLVELINRLRLLAMGRERTRGTGTLYAEYRDRISRRDLQELVKRIRREMRKEADALARRIEWHVPSVIWAMDDTEVQGKDEQKHKIHVVHDMGSRYTLRVLTDEMLADGWKIARTLVGLFEKYGAPLFMKMDNGGNLNHHAVLRVLSEYGVIPLNSPAYYPPYNGGMEHKQGELKTELGNWIEENESNLQVVRLAAEVSGHELNHKSREILGNRTACRAMDDGRQFARLFTRRDRKEVFEEITAMTVDIAVELDEHTNAAVETAFRYAAEAWMQSNNIITVKQNGEVLPPLYQIRTH